MINGAFFSCNTLALKVGDALNAGCGNDLVVASGVIIGQNNL